MLPNDLVINPATAIAGGTNAATSYSLIGGGTTDRTVRSVASLALTNPRTHTVGHLTRSLKGLRTVANPSISAPDVKIDRHTVRLDWNWAQTQYLDPDRKINVVCQLVFEVPRLGAQSPAVTDVADAIKGLVSQLCATNNQSLSQIINWES